MPLCLLEPFSFIFTLQNVDDIEWTPESKAAAWLVKGGSTNGMSWRFQELQRSCQCVVCRSERLMLDLNVPLGVLPMRLQHLQPGLPLTSLSRLRTPARLRRHFNTLERSNGQFFLHSSAAAFGLV